MIAARVTVLDYQEIRAVRVLRDADGWTQSAYWRASA